MEALVMLLQLVGLCLGIGSLVCFILVLIKMFQVGQTAMGIVCIVYDILWNRRIDCVYHGLDKRIQLENPAGNARLDGLQWSDIFCCIF